MDFENETENMISKAGEIRLLNHKKIKLRKIR